MSSREFSEWMAFAELEPFGEERADLRSAIVAAVFANANRDRKKRPRPFAPADFMPFREKAQPTSEDLRTKFRALTGNAHGDNR